MLIFQTFIVDRKNQHTRQFRARGGNWIEGEVSNQAARGIRT